MGSDKKLLTTDVFEAMAPSLDQARADVLVVHGDVWTEEPGYRYGQKWDLRRLLERNIKSPIGFLSAWQNQIARH